MARRDALMSITKNLVARRAELRKRLGKELDDLGFENQAGTGDVADIAFGSVGGEIASQLAQFEAKELAKVEHALVRIKQGKYGICEGCGGRIPVARLNALPYSILCVSCQREHESDAGWLSNQTMGDWSTVRDSSEDREVSVADLEHELGK